LLDYKLLDIQEVLVPWPFFSVRNLVSAWSWRHFCNVYWPNHISWRKVPLLIDQRDSNVTRHPLFLWFSSWSNRRSPEISCEAWDFCRFVTRWEDFGRWLIGWYWCRFWIWSPGNEEWLIYWTFLSIRYNLDWKCCIRMPQGFDLRLGWDQDQNSL